MITVTFEGLSVTFFQSMVIGLVFAALGLGFNIVYRVSKSINLAHPAVALLAAYVALVVSLFKGANVVVGIIVASLVGFAAGAATEVFVARPLRGRPPVALIAATLGVYYVLKAVAIWSAGPHWSGSSYSLPELTASIGPIVVGSSDLLAIAAAGGLLASTIALHRYTRLGVAMRATAEDPYGAAAYGLPLKKLTMISWGLSGLAGALAGIALAAKAGVTPGIEAFVLESLAASLLAGLDSVGGIVVGGIVLGVVKQFSDYLLGQFLPGVGDAAAFTLMLIVLLVKPYGLFGTERIERV